MSAAAPFLIVVAVALTDRNGLILVQQRPTGKSLAGLWEFPGGKVEVGETPEAALIRELAEELGIAVDAAHLQPLSFVSHPADDRHLLMLLYRARQWKGHPQPLEAKALQWVPLDGLRALAMPPADIPLIDVLERMR